MEHKKVLNLLNEASNSKFVTRKLSMIIYGAGNKVNYNTEVLKSNLCEYNDAYILVKGNITVTAAPETQVTFKSSYANAQPDRIYFKIILKQQELCCSSLKNKQLILMQILKTLMILNLSDIRLNY